MSIVRHACLCGVSADELWIGFYHLPCGGRHHQPYSRPRAQLDMKPKPSTMAAAGTPLELSIAPEHEPNAESDKVHEPATSSVPVSVLVECEGMEGSPAYTPTTEHELYLASGNYYNKEVEEDISLSLPSSLVPPSFKSPSSLLVRQAQISCISAGPVQRSYPRVFWSPAPSCQEDPLAQPPAANPITSPRLVGQSALHWLLPPSAPSGTFVLTAPPGSPVPPWSDVALPSPRTSGGSAVLCPCTPMASSGSAFPLALPWSAVLPTRPQSSGNTLDAGRCGYASESKSIGVTCSLIRGRHKEWTCCSSNRHCAVNSSFGRVESDKGPKAELREEEAWPHDCH
ncbi:hypothetical protein DPX16_10408 [Anabarilius grahami]|uniref:Uncharacterized protein n=1 Tax=Anabarilius grahami TaxID=495550 RepID=A0A3N0Y4X0_ANAGA|nr:hypothetical protein DPX16_10408 [Anabarilius grahami]